MGEVYAIYFYIAIIRCGGDLTQGGGFILGPVNVGMGWVMARRNPAMVAGLNILV